MAHQPARQGSSPHPAAFLGHGSAGGACHIGATVFTYAYDDAKRKKAETDALAAANTQQFAYDGAGRVSAWNTTSATRSWLLSPVGDWTATTVNGVTTTREHTPVHEVTAVGSTALLYDAHGNLTRDVDGQVYAWDYDDRLASATQLRQGHGDEAIYDYDALGRRVKKTVTTHHAATAAALLTDGIETTYFVPSGAQDVLEIDGELGLFASAEGDPELPGQAPFDPETGSGARGSLLADAVLRYNFQPPTTDTPDGWTADVGLTTPTEDLPAHLWSGPVAGVDREHLGRPLYDSFIPLSGQTWSVPVENGTHALVIMCGDADSMMQINHLIVNGVPVRDPTPYGTHATPIEGGSRSGAFDGYTLTVTVTDGFIHIAGAADAVDPKLCFVEIGPTGSSADAETAARVAAAAEAAAASTAFAKVPKPPVVRRNVWLSYVDELASYTITQPRHAVATRRYVHGNHLYSVAAVTDEAGGVVERYGYDAYGSRTVIGGASSMHSTLGMRRGFTGYQMDEETGLYYARARMYAAGLGRFIGRDPWTLWVGHSIDDSGYPETPANLVQYPWTMKWRGDGYSLYAATFAPNLLDPTGCFDTEDHNLIIGVGIGGPDSGFTPGDISDVRQGSKDSDYSPTSQNPANSFQHGMREPEQDPTQARQMTENYINSMIDLAAREICQGYKRQAMLDFGHALHASMDSFSPFHRDQGDMPLPWRGMSDPRSVPHIRERMDFPDRARDMAMASVGVSERAKQLKDKVCKDCPEKATKGWCPKSCPRKSP